MKTIFKRGAAALMVLAASAAPALAAPEKTICLRNDSGAHEWLEVSGNVCVGFMICFNAFTTKNLAPGEQQCWTHRQLRFEMITFDARYGSTWPADAQKRGKEQICRNPNVPIEGTISFRGHNNCNKI